MASNKIKGLTLEISGDTIGLNKALSEVNQTSRSLKSELKDVERLLKLDPGNTELIDQKQKILAESVENTAKKLETLKEAEKQVQEQFKRGEVAEDQYRAIQREVIKTEEELKSMNKQLQEMDWKKVTDGLDSFNQKATDIGKDLAKKVTAPIVAAGTASMKMASDFTDSMAKVSTLADTTQVSMEDLKKGILAISDKSGIAATDIASSIYDALSAGVDTANVLEYVNANVMLTKAGFTEMGTAIDATSTILNAYGDTAYDVSKIGDILVKTQDEGKISVDELGKNLGRVIPTASSLGINLDQLGASYAIMTAKGQNASIATTNLNSMLGELGKTGSKSDKALRDMTGKSFKELVSEGKTVGDVLGLLDDHAGKAGLSLSDMFGSTTAGSAALTLLSDGVDGFNSKVDIMNNSTGTMAANFEKLKTPSEEMKISINKIKNVLIELGEIILPVLSTFAEWIGKIADKFAGLDGGTKKIIVVIAALAAAIAPTILILGKLAGSISAIVTLFSAGGAAAGVLSGAMTVLTGPIGLVMAAVAALVSIGVLLYKNWDTIKEKAAELGNWISETWNALKEKTAEVWDNIKQTIKDNWEEAKENTRETIEELKTSISEAWSAIKEKTSEIWGNIKQAIADKWEEAKENTAETLKQLKISISEAWNTIKEKTSEIWGNIKQVISDKWEEIKEKIKEKINDVFHDMKQSFSEFKNIGKEMITYVWEGMKEIWSLITAWVSEKVSWLSDKLAFWRKSKDEMSSTTIKTNVNSYAKGTDYHPGGLAWVGELGPELVELPRGSKVHTNRDSMNMLGQRVEHSHSHTGTITVKGINDRNELIGVVDIVMDELRRGVRA